MENVRRIYFSIQSSKNKYDSFIYFEQILSYTFILIAQYEEVLLYVHETHKKGASYSYSYREAQLLEGFAVYRAIALLHTGREVEAKSIFDQIQTYKFNFLSKQFLTILYLHLKQQIKKSKTEQEQLQHLIKETGFKRLLGLTGFPEPYNKLCV